MTSGSAPTLIAIAGLAAGQTFELSSDEVVLGRDAGNQIAIADPSLSRKHSMLSRTADGWVIRDLGSVNGVIVNGQRVHDHRLAHGDHIVIGKTELLIRLDPQPATAERPDDEATVSLRLEDGLYLKTAAKLPELGRVQRDLQALVGIGTALAGIHERRALEQHLIDAAFEIVPADTAMLIRINPPETPEIACSRQRRDGELPSPSKTVLDDVTAKRVGFLSNNAVGEASLREAKSVLEAGITSVLAVPLIDRDNPCAVLYLTTTNRDITFDRLHLEVVTALAGIGSVAFATVGQVQSLKERSQRLQKRLRSKHDMVGQSEAIKDIEHNIGKVAGSELTVLINGETGTGKELAARAIHLNSKRSAWPFIAINCATIGENLLESDLFGHEKGAFTGADTTRRGKFELADRGTIFLDEIGELPLLLQAKLLRALQEREIERLGGLRPIKIDVRVIAATNRDLEEEVRVGRFRKDLLFRLNTFEVTMPALRDRREDVRLLADHFAARAAARAARPAVTFTNEAMARLITHEWPGNVRELENVVERAVVLCEGNEIVPEDLPKGLGQPQSSEPGLSRLETAVNEAKRRTIREALAESGGVITDAARLLGLHPNYLHRLMNSLNMRAPIRTAGDGRL